MDLCAKCDSSLLMKCICCEQSIYCISCNIDFHICKDGHPKLISAQSNGNMECSACGLFCVKYNQLYHICDKDNIFFHDRHTTVDSSTSSKDENIKFQLMPLQCTNNTWNYTISCNICKYTNTLLKKIFEYRDGELHRKDYT